jgi:flagellar export protein FliJ
MTWTSSLIRVRNFEIETLRKRLAAVLEARAALEHCLLALDAEAVSEGRFAGEAGHPAWSLAGWRAGWKLRQAKVLTDLKTLEREEQGCRDALAEAFLELKKVEQVAEAQADAAAKILRSREQAGLDEIALRRRHG